MKTTATARFTDAFGPAAHTADAPHTGAALATMVRQAVAMAERLICGTDQETARTAYLAQAIDQGDLERRASAWDRAQQLYRSLPPAL